MKGSSISNILQNVKQIDRDKTKAQIMSIGGKALGF